MREFEYQEFESSMLPVVRTRQIFPFKHPIDIPWVIYGYIMIRAEYIKAKLPQRLEGESVPGRLEAINSLLKGRIHAAINSIEKEVYPLTPYYILPPCEKNPRECVVLATAQGQKKVMPLLEYAFFIHRCHGGQICITNTASSGGFSDARIFVIKDNNLVGLTMEIPDRRVLDL